jgi:outer membrane protein assembly factor BamB
MTPIKSLAACLLCLSASPGTAAPDWPEWRGPTRDGRVPEGTEPWPPRLNRDNFVEVWSVDLAEGYSSPITSGDRVFTVETKDKKDEIVRAFDRRTGKLLWETSWPGSMKVPFFAAKSGSWVRSTPACDGTTLFVGGMLDVLVALDAASGRERWRVDFPAQEDTPRPQFGFVCSPMLDDEHVYVQVGAALRKIRKDNGRTEWKALEDERAMFGSAFSSPTRAVVCGRDQLLVQTRMLLAGVEPRSGEVLWSTPVKAFRGMNILTPTPIGDRIFTATYGGGSFVYQVRGKADPLAVETLWNDELEGNMSSPVVIDGMVYLHGRDKRFHCIDPVAQKILWSTDKSFGDYWSMVANGRRILALDDRGELLLIEADPDGFRLIDTLEVSKRPTWAHVAVCGEEVWIRDLKGLTLYRWRE